MYGGVQAAAFYLNCYYKGTGYLPDYRARDMLNGGMQRGAEGRSKEGLALSAAPRFLPAKNASATWKLT